MYRIAKPTTCFTTDNQGNFYIATENNTVIRYNSDGDSTGYFSSKRRGRISQIDASNPLNILVYHQDLANIVVLNGTLNEKFSIDLRKYNIYICPVVAYSADGDIWVYNSLEAKMHKVPANSDTKELDLKQSSFNFQQIFTQNVQPTYMAEFDRQVIIADSSIGIIRFDQFGNYIATYPFQCKNAQLVGNTLIFFMDNTVRLYNVKSLKEASITVPSQNKILDVRAYRNKLIVRTETAIEVYDYPLQ